MATKKSYKDYFLDPEGVELQAKSLVFLMRERVKLDDFLVDVLNECDGDTFQVTLEQPELCDYAVYLDKRIALEGQRLKELIDKERNKSD